MIKHSIRLTSFLLALFTFLLVLQYLTIEQQQLPFNTTERFELYIANLDISKDEIINELNKIADENDSILAKVATDSKEYKSKKDIIWFGVDMPKPDGIFIENNKIQWLDEELTGELVASSDMGTRPLYGVYAVQGNEKFKEEITKWGNENGINIFWYPQNSFLNTIYSYLIYNGIGNAIITAFLLFLTTLIAWFVIHARARTIRLLGGVRDKRIHIEDTLSIIMNTIIGFILALVVVLGYIGFSNRICYIPLILQKCLIALLFLFILSGALVYAISISVRPKTEHLVSRKIPLKRFRLLGTGTRILAIVWALLIVPSTISYTYIFTQLSNEYSLWENIQSNVRLSFSYTDPLVTDEMMPYVEQFCNEMEEQNNMCLSFVIDEAIALDAEEYGGYDHIIVADKAWASLFEIGVGKDDKGGQLTEVSFETLADPLRDFLNAQVPLLTKTGTVQPDGIGYYEFSGGKFLALPPSVAYSGVTIQADNPLVILVDDPASTLSIKGFIVAALSSGNIVFADEEILQAALINSPIKEYVSSINTIADIALGQAQLFGKEAGYYTMACILVFAAMIFAGIMNAQLWTGSNKKRIFTLHTFGKTYSNIIHLSFRKELIVAGLTIMLGSVLSFVLRRPEPVILICVAIITALLYSVSNYLSYQVCVRKIFYKASQRNEL